MFKNLSQTAKYLGVAQNTLRKIIIEDSAFPRPIQISERRIGFKIDEVDAWIESRRVRTMEEAG